MTRPTISEIDAVVTVARTRSFRGAARELGVSASALSHAIASLEQRLRVRLFARSTRSVALTDEGDAFVARLGGALREIDGAVADLAERSATPRGTLRLVAPRGPAQVAVLPAVLEMRRKHRDVTVELVTDPRPVDIVAEGYDAGVRYVGTVPRDMVSIACGADLGVAIVASPGYLKRRRAPTTHEDLAAHECLRYRKDAGIVKRWDLRVRGRAVAVEVTGHLVFDDEAFLVAAALDGAGLAYVSLASAAPHLDSGRLVRVLETVAPRYPPVQLFYPSHTLVRAALRAFVDVVKQLRLRSLGR